MGKLNRYESNNITVVWVLSLEYLVGSGWILKHGGSFWMLVPSYTEQS